MITNDRQFKITKNQAQKFLAAINSFHTDPNNSESERHLAELRLAQLKSQLEDLESQIQEYEDLASGSITDFEANSLAELPKLLIKARIARGWTQKQLATRLNLKEQQIQRYEGDSYMSASLSTIQAIADILELRVSEYAHLDISEKMQQAGGIQPEIFKEMYKRGWFETFSGTLTEARRKSSTLLDTFFLSTAVDHRQPALHRKKIRAKSAVDEYALAAWQSYVIKQCDHITLGEKFDSRTLTKEWFRELAKLSTYRDGPLRARDWLLHHGIYFVFCSALPKTHLDGAALKHPDGQPIVAITGRHDRLDNFWFVLFHELGHVLLHFPSENFSEYFDDADAASNDIELEADNFALNALIDKESWESCMSRFSLDSETVLIESKTLKISPAILAGRIRHDTRNYTILNEVVGYKSVRYLFDPAPSETNLS